MSSHRYFCPDLRPGVVALPPEESRHAATVMRARPGDVVEVFDGAGHVTPAAIEQVGKRTVSVRIGDVRLVPFELRHRLTLAVAMAKAHRQGYLVEKCTELGVAEIWPILAERSVTRPGEAAVEKWQRRAIEAAKQSGRAWVPMIAPVISFAEAVSRADRFSIRCFCDTTDDAVAIQTVLGYRASGTCGVGNRPSNGECAVVAFVGPEGGWTEAERDAARDAGLMAVRLSPTTLRAETAAVAVCAVVASASVESPC